MYQIFLTVLVFVTFELRQFLSTWNSIDITNAFNLLKKFFHPSATISIPLRPTRHVHGQYIELSKFVHKNTDYFASTHLHTLRISKALLTLIIYLSANIASLHAYHNSFQRITLR